jgi:hypothetical protein
MTGTYIVASHALQFFYQIEEQATRTAVRAKYPTFVSARSI